MRSQWILVLMTFLLVSCSQNLGTQIGAESGSTGDPGPSSSSVPSGSGGGSNITFSGGSD